MAFRLATRTLKPLLPARTMSTTTRIPVALEVTSDSICPFCYVGYKRITKAIQMAKDADLPLDFSISFAPFLLDPTLPNSPGETKRDRYIRKFGGAEKVAAMEQAMIERGKAEGINFSYGGVVSQTTDSHRMISKARELKGEEGQLRFVERTFKTYFEEEGDPGSHNLLARDAETAGIMSKDDALAFLKTDELKSEVEAGIRKAQLRGISGVPFTILNGKLGISGAQETETFYEVFEKIAKGELEA
ncbi:thioredoxin-like protein [Leucosporidium creatinivorum]|uniref:Thioredoxin-like protein n=1 Tax=Leucosporidium creatinivorum TaxID=106004 RepID=A0A1Y2EXY4_9BASI|nr:thioredoxin-like protein [Leucosporidium creatinivorum]